MLPSSYKNLIVYNRFGKTPLSQGGDVGKARFQASPQIDGKAVESLPKKTPPFQSGEAYQKAKLLTVETIEYFSTHYWLDVISETKKFNNQKIEDFLQKNTELIKILTTIMKNLDRTKSIAQST